MKLKKIISLVLALCFMFSLVSCGNSETLNTTGETDATATGENQTGSANASDRTIETVGAHKALEAIPVAQPGMSIDELREICTNYMRIQTSVPWIPAESYDYTIDSKHDEQHFNRNVVYGGLPYTHNSASLYTFLEFYNDETGVLTLPNRALFNTIIGNDCADAVFWGWSRFSTSISFILTQYMQESNGALRIGSYTYPDTVTDFTQYTTRRICDENGEQTMYESYALVKKGDAFVMCTTAGHTIMASCDAIVIRNMDGTINPNESGIYVLEQHSTQVPRPLSVTNTQYQDIIDGKTITPVVPDGGGSSNDPTVYNIGGVDNFFSFATLFQKSYLPVTCAELRGKAVEKAAVSVEGLPEATSDISALNEAVVNSNYRISKVLLTFTDADGKVVYETSQYGKEKYMFSMPIQLTQSATKRALTKGQTYTFTVSAIVGTSETLVAGTCSFTA